MAFLDSLNSNIGNQLKTEPMCKLTNEVSNLDRFSEEQEAGLRNLYENKDPAVRGLASVLNAILTQQKLIFLFSKRILADILANDKNLKRNSVNSDFYSAVRKKVLEHRVLKILTPEKSKFAAQVFECVYPEIVTVVRENLGDSIIETQRNAVLEFRAEAIRRGSLKKEVVSDSENMSVLKNVLEPFLEEILDGIISSVKNNRNYSLDLGWSESLSRYYWSLDVNAIEDKAKLIEAVKKQFHAPSVAHLLRDAKKNINTLFKSYVELSKFVHDSKFNFQIGTAVPWNTPYHDWKTIENKNYFTFDHPVHPEITIRALPVQNRNYYQVDSMLDKRSNSLFQYVGRILIGVAQYAEEESVYDFDDELISM